LAVATVCAALPLLVLGAEVTTKKVGMADPKGFRAPWYLFVVIWEKIQQGETPEAGLVIEYSHRLAGFLVGTCAIGLAVLLWLKEKRAWRRCLGLAALIAVVAQGLLGIYRVDLHTLFGQSLALVHGCFAQVVFALLVTVAVLTSRAWSAPVDAPANPRESKRLRRWTIFTSLFIYLQLVFGAIVRHRDVPFGARVHLLLAFGVVAAVLWLARMVFETRPRPRTLTGAMAALLVLVVLQLLLGVESWLSRFPSADQNQAQPLPLHPELLRSLHYFVGSLIFASSVTVALFAARQTVPAGRAVPAALRRLEAAV
jgi:cytochrome c oxidase assembly protein subunit 15